MVLTSASTMVSQLVAEMDNWMVDLSAVWLVGQRVDDLEQQLADHLVNC